MKTQDLHGHHLSGADARAAEHYERACALLRCYRGDPLADAQAAIAQRPDMTMAHVLAAYLNLLGTEPAAVAAAQAAHAAAATLPADEREGLHVRAAGRLAQGRWHDAGRILEDLSARYPHDLLALQVGHQIDFFTGALTHAARPHRARAAVVARRHAGLPCACCRCWPSVWKKRGDYAQRRDATAGAASSRSRTTAGAGMRWRM